MSAIPGWNGNVDQHILASNRYANLLNFLKYIFLAIWGKELCFDPN